MSPSTPSRRFTTGSLELLFIWSTFSLLTPYSSASSIA